MTLQLSFRFYVQTPEYPFNCMSVKAIWSSVSGQLSSNCYEDILMKDEVDEHRMLDL